MTPKLRAPVFLAFLVLAAEAVSVFAGDSLYGTVVAVKEPTLVVFDFGNGKFDPQGRDQYEVRIAGVAARPSFKAETAGFVKHLVEDRGVRMRLVRREKGEMVAQLLVDDPDPKIVVRDVALELLRAGLAVRVGKDDRIYRYKYSELQIAEKDGLPRRRAPLLRPTP